MEKLSRSDYLRFALFCFPAVAFFWIFKYSANLDIPNHLARAYVLSECALGSGGSVCDGFSVSILPIPFILADVLMAVALIIFSPPLAEKLLLTLVIFLTAHSWMLLYKQVHGKIGFVSFLAFPFLFSNFIFLGFYGFVLSLPICMYGLAYWWPRRSSLQFVDHLVLLLVLLLAFLAHLSGLLFFVVSIGCYYCINILKERSIASVGNGILSVSSVVLGFVALYLMQQALTDGTSDAAWGFRPLVNKVLSFAFPVTNFSKITDSILALFPFLLLGFVAFYKKDRRKLFFTSFWTQLGVLFFLAFSVLPVAAFGAYDFDVRFLGLSYFFLILGFGAVTYPRAWILGILVLACEGAYFANMLFHMRTINAFLTPVYALMDEVPEGSRVLLLNSYRNMPDDRISRVSPTPHIHAHLLLNGKAEFVSGLFDCVSNRNLSYFCHTDKGLSKLDFYKFHFLGPESIEVKDLFLASSFFDTVLVFSKSGNTVVDSLFASSPFKLMRRVENFSIYRLRSSDV